MWFFISSVFNGLLNTKSLSDSSNMSVILSIFWTFFPHSVWDLCDSSYNGWLSIEIAAFWVFYDETLHPGPPSGSLTLLQREWRGTTSSPRFPIQFALTAEGSDSLLLLNAVGALTLHYTFTDTIPLWLRERDVSCYF